MKSSSKRVTARYRPISRVSPIEIMKMYSIFRRYYENASLDTFVSDMSAKTGVFMLQRRTDGQIVGFSTVAKMDMNVDGRRIKGVFSGDTILEQEYWGSRALPLAFFLYLIRTVLRHPLTPVFWLLISKGYKTYLLMANNFFRFYPHPENRYQEYKPLIADYCERLFPGYYDSDRGVLDFGDSYQHLKDSIAPITDEMRKASLTVAFFEERNPEWRRGTELPCIGRAGISDLFRYLFRYCHKLWRKPSHGRSVVTAANPAVLPAVSEKKAQVSEKKAQVSVTAKVVSSNNKQHHKQTSVV